MSESIIINDIAIEDLLQLINKDWLYTGLWKLKGEKEEGEKVFNRFAGEIEKFNFSPISLYRIFDAELDEDVLTIGKQAFEFDQDALVAVSRKSGYDLSNNKIKIAICCSTIGDKFKDISKELHKDGNYSELFYLNGFAAALTEALTELVHDKVCESINVERKKSFRISPGYPAWKDLRDQQKIDELITLENVGISLSETNHLVPEFSTTSLVFL